MAAAGKPISREFHSSLPPEGVVRDFVLQADGFSRLGYQLEGHTHTTAMLARRFTPRIAYLGPLAVALSAIVIGLAGTVQSAAAGGRIALFAVVAAGVLSLVVKSTERLTLSATPDGEGSRVLVSGTAIPELEDWVSECGNDDHLGASPDAEGRGSSG